MNLLQFNPVIQHFPSNKVGRDFVMGDPHGCLHLINTLLAYVKFDETKDRLFIVGDLVDRGLFSEKTLELLREPWVHCVLGNHEDLTRDAMVWFLKENNAWCGIPLDWSRVEAQAGSHIANGGMWLQKKLLGKGSLEDKIAYCEEFIERINKLPLVIAVGEGDERFNIVHSEISLWGDVATDHKLDNDPNAELFVRDDFIWARNFFAYNKAAVKANPNGYQNHALSITYCGHTPQYGGPTKVARQINIDTCAFYADFISKDRNGTNGLTIVEPSSFDFWTVNGATHEVSHQNLTNPNIIGEI